MNYPSIEEVLQIVINSGRDCSEPTFRVLLPAAKPGHSEHHGIVRVTDACHSALMRIITRMDELTGVRSHVELHDGGLNIWFHKNVDDSILA